MNPHEEGDSEGKTIHMTMLERNFKYKDLKYKRRNTNTIFKGMETHKTMLEEGGGSEKAFTGICEQMVCKNNL